MIRKTLLLTQETSPTIEEIALTLFPLNVDTVKKITPSINTSIPLYLPSPSSSSF